MAWRRVRGNTPIESAAICIAECLKAKGLLQGEIGQVVEDIVPLIHGSFNMETVEAQVKEIAYAQQLDKQCREMRLEEHRRLRESQAEFLKRLHVQHAQEMGFPPVWEEKKE